jgi:hypothetical protein
MAVADYRVNTWSEQPLGSRSRQNGVKVLEAVVAAAPE